MSSYKDVENIVKGCPGIKFKSNREFGPVAARFVTKMTKRGSDKSCRHCTFFSLGYQDIACACACVRERDRQRRKERKSETERERDSERENECVRQNEREREIVRERTNV